MDDETDTFSFENALPILVEQVTTNSVSIKRQTKEFILLPAEDALSDSKANSKWSTLFEGFDYAVNYPTILLDKFILPEDMCNSLVDGIRNGTASIVSDRSFAPNSPIGKAGISAVILAPSTICQPKYWVKGWNWVTGPEASQSAHRRELAGVIATLTILDIIVRHHNITDSAVTIALDRKTAMNESRGDWPLSINQK